MDNRKKFSDFLKELKKEDDDAKKNIEGDKFRNRYKILADSILEANVADKLRFKQLSSHFNYYGGDITQEDLSTLNMSGNLLPKGFANDESLEAVGALSAIPGDIGKAASAASKIASKVLDVVAPFDKRLGSARAKAQGIDIFADNQYIVNNEYPDEDDPRRYEIDYNAGAKYGEPYASDPRYLIHINKDDQTRYLTYQMYIAKLGFNLQKWVPFLSPTERNYLFPSDDHNIAVMQSLAKLHGH